ncbi:unnamed protein product [Closterium sp. NIES-64]|nr:unnamed protein product [Closterium sp. NIES-64]
MCHMTACSLFSYVAIVWMKIVPLQPLKSSSQLLRIVALSAVFCFSVVGGNTSLRFIPVSFNQAIGATTPFFTAVFAYLLTFKREAALTYAALLPVVLGVVIATGAIGATTPFFTAVFAYLLTFKREAALTYAALLPVVLGVVIATGSEPSFHLFGFIICVSATAARALKSVLQGLLLQSDGHQLNSMNLLFCMAPIAVLLLLPATLIIEPTVLAVAASKARACGLAVAARKAGQDWGIVLHQLNSMNLLFYMAPIAVLLLLPATLIIEPTVLAVAASKAGEDWRIVPLLLVNSSTAFFVNLTNFLVTRYTSALTLQVLSLSPGALTLSRCSHSLQVLSLSPGALALSRCSRFRVRCALCSIVS